MAFRRPLRVRAADTPAALMRFVTAKNAATNFIMSYNFFFETAFGESYYKEFIGIFDGGTRARTWDPLRTENHAVQVGRGPSRKTWSCGQSARGWLRSIK